MENKVKENHWGEAIISGILLAQQCWPIYSVPMGLILLFDNNLRLALEVGVAEFLIIALISIFVIGGES
jgi:hypothetical protein